MTERKVAIVTGGADGIGRATVHAFVLEGYDVAVIDQSDVSLEQLQYEIPEDALLAVQGDVSNEQRVRYFFAALTRRFGRVDVLVNNAGVRFAGSIEDTPIVEFDQVMGVKCFGTFLMTRAAIPYLLERGGAIINVSSSAGIGLDSGAPLYSASKAWINKFTECLALQLGPRGIRVNAICPGSVRTDFLRAAFNNDDEAVEASASANPLKRIAEPREIAEAILWLASDKAQFVNGAIFSIDGGERLAGEPVK